MILELGLCLCHYYIPFILKQYALLMLHTLLGIRPYEYAFGERKLMYRLHTHMFSFILPLSHSFFNLFIDIGFSYSLTINILCLTLWINTPLKKRYFMDQY